MEEVLVYKIKESIEAPIEKVFSFLSDDDKIKVWSQIFVENIYESEQDKLECKPGTKYKTVSKFNKKIITTEAVLLEYDFPYSTAVQGNTDQGVMTTRYLLEAYEKDNQIVTRLMLETYIVPKNWYYKLMVKLLGWTSKIMMEEELEKLKTIAEEKE
ncbi:MULTISPECIES: SRPBCC family protein [Bacillus]|uniref:SRPBCC family protein n=1 Tax=Bacillus TaxID=1386 RepID=UPI0002E47D0E|nr:MULTISPECIES: SRPBCC family protein [Bacillus]